MTPKEAWEVAYNQLELQLDRASFDTWLRQAVFLGVDDEGVFRIGVHNSYAQDMLQYRLYRNIKRVLSDICGKPTEVLFEVHKPRSEPQPTDIPAHDDPPLFRFLAQQETLPDLPETSRPLHQSMEQPRFGDLPESELNPRFTFNRFVVNKSNQMVYEAALAVAEYPATAYNPFFIYGGVGLGKTHILQSIGHICQQRGLRTIYVPSEAFTNDLVHAIRNRSTAMFREKYRSVDVLLMDDIQFISGKESTQEEFFHTFNALANFNKQIVMTSDRHPSELRTLEDRLRSRFQGGLVADIQPPELETREAILQMWAHEREIYLPEDVIRVVAERAPSNIRELEGVFNQLVAQAHYGRSPVSLPAAEHTLDLYERPRERVSLDHIIRVTANNLGFEPQDLIGKRRTSRINKARQIAMYLAREMTEFSLPQIGEAFGGRSHTTVLHGANKIAEELETDRVLESKLEKLRGDITRRRR